MDDAGRIYRNVNTEALFADIVPASYFMRNPNVVRTRGLYEDLVDPNKTRHLAGAADARRQSRLPRRAAARRTAPPPTTRASRRR